MNERHHLRSPAVRGNDPRPQEPPVITVGDLAERAYEIWLRNGSVPGREKQSWQEATSQLRREHRT